MIEHQLEFHNTAELESLGALPGQRLQRFPREVRDKLGHMDHERGRFQAQIAVGCEIRFVTEAKFVKVYLSASEHEGVVFVYKGSLLHSVHKLSAGVISCLHLEEPPKFKDVDPAVLHGRGFAPSVWRLLFGKNSPISFIHLDTFGHAVRPPLAAEKPPRSWLAYGSSITFGGDTHLYTNTYVQQAAVRLNLDVLNKGIAGSCFCDQAAADYLASITCDLVTLELGINMLNRFSCDEFRDRASYLVDTLRAALPGKPIAILGIFPHSVSLGWDRNSEAARKHEAFNQISREIVRERADRRLYFIPGEEILTAAAGLTVDLLHPSDDGHIMMGEALARKLGPIINGSTERPE